MRNSLLLGLLAAVLALENQSVPVAGATTAQRRLGEAGPSSGGESTSSPSSSSAAGESVEAAAIEEHVEEQAEEVAAEEHAGESSSSSSSSSSSESSEHNAAASSESYSSYSYDSSDEYTDSCVEAWDEADSESFKDGVKYVWCELILHWYIGLGVLFFLLCCLAGDRAPLTPHPSHPPPTPSPAHTLSQPCPHAFSSLLSAAP